MLNIIKAYAVNNLCYKTALKMTPKGIVVHSTGANNPHLKRYVDAPNEVGINTYGNHWNNEKPDGRNVCVHAFIGYDKNNQVRVAEILPLNICCWGVGRGKKGSYNYCPPYIQFEICEDSLNDKDYYQKTFKTAAEYCAELCHKFSINVSNVVGHCEAYQLGYGSNHSDPEHWMKKHGETMADFRNTVTAILNTFNDTEKSTNETSNNSTEFNKGDLVSIIDDAKYLTGITVPIWVKSQNWYIKEQPRGNRVVIDCNESGTTSICSPIDKKYLKLVKIASDISNNNKQDTNNCPYLVRIIIDSLNIRKNAGTDSAIVNTITDKGVYTIVEEKQGVGASMWGKLKSGIGWISLDYVKKI